MPVIRRSTPRSGTTMQKQPKSNQENERGYFRRRHTLPGHPAFIKFTTEEEVVAYVSGDRIECLICGKQYKNLSAHLNVHGLDHLQYRMRFNIPLHVALITKDILNRMREKATTPERLAIAKANIALAPKNTGRRARFLTDFRRQAQAKRMVEKTLPFRVPPKPTISDDVILEFERLVLEDKLSVSQAAKKVGHAYQALNYGRMRMARAKGLPPPVALVSPQRAKVALGKKTSPVMTAEIVKQVDELVAHGGFTIRNALRSLGWAQPATYYSWKKRHGYKER